MSIDVLSQCEQADRGVTWCKGEVERADEQEVAALEERLRWLECRAAGRREEQKKKAVERERNQALFRVQLAIDLKEERHWGREQDRLQELDDMSYLFRKQDEDAFAAALYKVMSRGTTEARQREHEESIAVRETGLQSLRTRAHAASQARLDARRIASEQRSTVLAAADAEIKRHQQQSRQYALDALAGREQHLRAAISDEEANACHKLVQPRSVCPQGSLCRYRQEGKDGPERRRTVASGLESGFFLHKRGAPGLEVRRQYADRVHSCDRLLQSCCDFLNMPLPQRHHTHLSSVLRPLPGLTSLLASSLTEHSSSSYPRPS